MNREVSKGVRVVSHNIIHHEWQYTLLDSSGYTLCNADTYYAPNGWNKTTEISVNYFFDFCWGRVLTVFHFPLVARSYALEAIS